MSGYREFGPPAALAGLVECFWAHTRSEHAVRVMPDTCVDLIYSRERGLQFVGTMTRAVVDHISEEQLLGARLRAAAVRAFFNINVSDLNNRVVAIENLGIRAHECDEASGTRVLERCWFRNGR